MLLIGCTNKEKKEKAKSSVQNQAIVEQTKPQTENIKTTQNDNVEPKSDGKINLDKILESKYNRYLASFENGDLSMCSYDLLDVTKNIIYSKFQKSTEEYNPFEKTELINVYRKDSSYVKTYLNEYITPSILNVVCGKIQNQELIMTYTYHIGMEKTNFLELLFQPSEKFKDIESLTIYQDEAGEASTSYRFVNDTLREITFDSDIDWVERK
jgi:hypothetical protein